MKTIIKNATIIDGSGSEGFKSDIYIEDGKIKEIGTLQNKTADKTIDASGKLVTPGFVDIHRHCDYAVLKDDFGELELAQGITTVVTGLCGLTPFPLNKKYEQELNNLLSPCLGESPNVDLFANYNDYANHLEKNNFPLNIGNLVGSCAVRIAVKGFEKAPFTLEELELAKQYVEQSLLAGALGISMGIMYYPEFFSTKEELIEIAKVIAKHNSVLTCHIRGEGDSLVESVEEIIYIAEMAKCSLQISHFKSGGVKNWNNLIYKAMKIIEEKRSQGLDIEVDFYPYNGGSTTLMSLIPPVFMKETLAQTWDYMATEQGVAEFRETLLKTYDDWDNYVLAIGFERIIITTASMEHNQKYVGKSISQIVEEFGIDPYGFMCKIMSEEIGMVGIIVMSMSADDVDAVAKLEYSTIISDALYSDSKNPHPRLYGAMPKILRDFVKERKVLTLENAISKMTYRPAKKMGIQNKGLIKVGFDADINIFELENICDNATFENSTRLATGMDYVIINGEIAWQNEKIVNKKLGSFIRRKYK